MVSTAADRRRARYALVSLSQYLIVLIGGVWLFRVLGVSWANVQWLVAAISVGLGFGLQEIFANFVSGLIVLFERPIRVGDIVTIGGVSGTVTRIRARATSITDWDRKELIVPNKEFITGQLINWTLSDSVLRVVIKVALSYGATTPRLSRPCCALRKRIHTCFASPAASRVHFVWQCGDGLRAPGVRLGARENDPGDSFAACSGRAIFANCGFAATLWHNRCSCAHVSQRRADDHDSPGAAPMSRRLSRAARREFKRRTPPGASPGMIVVDPAAPAPEVSVMAYGQNKLIEEPIRHAGPDCRIAKSSSRGVGSRGGFGRRQADSRFG